MDRVGMEISKWECGCLARILFSELSRNRTIEGNKHRYPDERGIATKPYRDVISVLMNFQRDSS